MNNFKRLLEDFEKDISNMKKYKGLTTKDLAWRYGAEAANDENRNYRQHNKFMRLLKSYPEERKVLVSRWKEAFKEITIRIKKYKIADMDKTSGPFHPTAVKNFFSEK